MVDRIKYPSAPADIHRDGYPVLRLDQSVGFYKDRGYTLKNLFTNHLDWNGLSEVWEELSRD